MLNRQLNLQTPGPHGRPIVYDLIYAVSSTPRPVIIFVHGFKGYKDWGTFPLVADAFAEAGFFVLKFNFSHNGGTLEDPIDFPDLEAFGENTYSKEQDDLAAVLDLLHRDESLHGLADLNHVALVGHSRGGGAVILKAAADSRVHQLVTWAAVADFAERHQAFPIDQWQEQGVITIRNGRTMQDMPLNYTLHQDILENGDTLKIERAAQAIADHKPWLVVHGEADEAVSIEDARRLGRWNPYCRALLIPEAGHTFGGKHPWDEAGLPPHLKTALDGTLTFLKGQG